MNSAPAAETKVRSPDCSGFEPEAELQHQRQEERDRADADAEERAAEHARAEGRDAQAGRAARAGARSAARGAHRRRPRRSRRRRRRRETSIGQEMAPAGRKPEHQAARPKPESTKPATSSGGGSGSRMFSKNRLDEHDAEKPDRDVDEEDPAPVEIGGDEAAERRADHRPDHAPEWSDRRAPRRSRSSGRCAGSRAGRPAPSWPRPCPAGSARATKPPSESAARRRASRP